MKFKGQTTYKALLALCGLMLLSICLPYRTCCCLAARITAPEASFGLGSAAVPLASKQSEPEEHACCRKEQKSSAQSLSVVPEILQADGASNEIEFKTCCACAESPYAQAAERRIVFESENIEAVPQRMQQAFDQIDSSQSRCQIRKMLLANSLLKESRLYILKCSLLN